MGSMAYFMKHHPALFEAQSGDGKLYVGMSDMPWVYMQVTTETELNRLLAQLPSQYNNFALVEDWMVPMIDPKGTRTREMTCELMVLPESVQLPEWDSSLVEALRPEDAAYIQSHHAYAAYTDLDYVKEQITCGKHAGVRVNGALVAWAITHDDGAVGFLYVMPEYRGCGYAKLITLKIIQDLRAEGLPIHVHIEKENSASMTLATQMGFVREKTIRWFTLEAQE